MNRLWSRPLWMHAVALGVVLVCVVPIVGVHASLSADEGAAIVQARTLSRDGRWLRPHPLSAVDPDGRMYPLENSGEGPAGIAPFVRHPLYALMLAAADRVGGIAAMVLLSIAGTLGAATTAARLAGRRNASLARPSLWAVGLASPLVFDSYLVIAHALGAALAGGAMLAALAFLDRRRWPALVTAAAAVAVTVLLRSEGVLFGGALAAVVGVSAWRRSRAVAVVSAAAIAGAAAIAYLGEAAWQAAILGGRGSAAGLPDASGSRLAAFTATWLSPGAGPRRLGEAALVVMLIVSVAAAVELRRGRARTATALAAAAAGLAVVRLLAGPADVIPGLLVAFPLVAIGLVATRRLDPLAAVAGLFALGVLATQYGRGGTTEWGGRYFALGLPIAVPVFVGAVHERLVLLARNARLAITAALCIQAAALAIVAVASLRVGHQLTAGVVDAAARAPSSRNAVVLTGNGAVPRLAWSLLDRQRWLLVQDVDVRTLGRRLRDARIDEVTVVDPIADTRLRSLPGYERVRDVPTGRATRWRVTVLRATT
ncbi:MAG TPA: hypothetical protein VFB78_00240 [Acidimicrobiales bacterium]|nr:hypothetical protein [Acidimicrobiales bacterium]